MKSTSQFLLWFILLTLFPLTIQGAPAPGPWNLDSLPATVPDSTSPDWVVEPFAGSASTGQIFYQGPRRETGGIGQGGVPLVLSDGTTYVSCGGGLAEADTAGVLRLIMGGDGLLEGPIEQCFYGGGPVLNPKDGFLYLYGPNCIRRIVKKPDNTLWVEVFAGRPNVDGRQDGPVATATIGTYFRFRCAANGVFYFLDNDGEDNTVRKIENGVVSTIKVTWKDPPWAFDQWLNHRNFDMGEDDSTLYVMDAGHVIICKVDLRKNEVTRIGGIPQYEGDHAQYPAEIRWERRDLFNADGPALTHFNIGSGGSEVIYDPFHKAILFCGDDENRFRWLKDGWVTTLIGAQVLSVSWNHYCGVDARGGIYLNATNLPYAVFRAYNPKEVK